jgi:hypothetical protein
MNTHQGFARTWFGYRTGLDGDGIDTCTTVCQRAAHSSIVVLHA